MRNWPSQHLLQTDRLPDKLNGRCAVRSLSRFMFDRHKHPTFLDNAIATPPQPVRLRGNPNSPIRLHSVTHLFPRLIHAAMLDVPPCRVIVVGEVLLVVDDRPLAGAVDPVLDL